MGYPDPEARRGWYVPPDDDKLPGDEPGRARWCGLAPSALQGLRSLVRERDSRTWDIGDALVQLYGPPPPSGILDGSHVRLDRLAIVLGLSRSWLISLRLTSAAWPPRQRRHVAWSMHADLRGWPKRDALLSKFLDDCRRASIEPTRRALGAWLEKRRDTPGRRLDPVARVERLALGLTDDTIERLIEHLVAALAARARDTDAA